MKPTGVIRAVRQASMRKSVLLRLYSVDENGCETLAATSAPVTKVAATAICRLFEAPVSVRPDVDSLTRVFRIYGMTAWASFTARDASVAAMRACMQHDMRRAQGALVIITLSMESNIVENVKEILAVIFHHAPGGAETGLLVAYDQSLDDRVKVELLLVGM